MAELNRREVLRLLCIAPLASALGLEWTAIDEAHTRVRVARGAGRIGPDFEPQFFSAHEYETVRILVDLIIPRDERSGGATDAGVPEFMDFILGEQEWLQTRIRGGLAWLDIECRRRLGQTFVQGEDAERREVLDLIAWPRRAKPEHSHGVAFFNQFRDLTATGFWSSKMGVEDLQYMGNRPHAWDGCPDEQLRKLGVRYE